MMPTDSVIAALVADAKPVRRLRPPVWRASGWVGIAIVVMLVLVWWHGPRADLQDRLRDSGFVLGLAAAAATGILAAVAALAASLPDRPRLWLLLPVPAGLVWIGTVSLGCLSDWVAMGPGSVTLDGVLNCVGVLLFSGIPLSVALFWMLRATARLLPVAVFPVAGLAVAGLSAAVLNVVHAFDASALVLFWNFGAAAVLLACDAAIGRMILRTRPGDGPAGLQMGRRFGLG